jgi:hypothetical protein
LTEEKKTSFLRSRKVPRDTAILSFAIAAGAWEITVGGGRPQVLTFVAGVLLSPAILRIEEGVKNDKSKQQD